MASTGDELKTETVSGLSWTLGGNVTMLVLNGVFTVCMLRLLVPEDFGLFGIVAVIAGAVRLLADLGYSQALVHRQDVDRAMENSVFWAHIVVGLVLTALFYLAAKPLAVFFEEPALREVLWIVGVQFVARAPSIVPMTLLRKQLRFRTLTLIELGAFLVGAVVAVYLAWTGHGATSLAWQAVVGAVLASLSGIYFCRWRPGLQCQAAALRSLSGYGMNFVGFTIVAFAIRNVDRLLIGKVLGAGLLGLYTKAYDLVYLPLSGIYASIGKVLFPVLAKIQDDSSRARDVTLKTLRGVTAVTFPLMIGLGVVAEPLVVVAFGEKWIEMVPLLWVFSWVGLLESLCAMNGSLYLSQGRTDLQFRRAIVFGALGLGATASGLPWGIEGVAYAYAAYTLIVTYPSVRLAGALVGLEFRDVVRTVLPQFLCACLMGLLVAVLPWVLPRVPMALQFALQVVLGFVVYVSVGILAKLEAFSQARAMIRERRPRESAT